MQQGCFCKDCKNGVSPEVATGPATLADVDPDHKFEEKAVDRALGDKNLDLKLYRDSQKNDRLEERRDARAGVARPAVARTRSSKPAAAPPAAPAPKPPA